MLDRIRHALTPKSVRRIKERLAAAQDDIDLLRSKIDLSPQLVHDFLIDRDSAEYQAVYGKAEPLVSICVATYNRSALLLERSVASILGQSYTNLELIVVGDCCTDDTVERMQGVSDSRLRFYNLPERGRYPEDRLSRWMVAGTTPINFALAQARGDFITHLDDDDAYLPDRLERLVAFIQKTRSDLVWHPYYNETKSGKWEVRPANEFRMGQVTTSSIFYHRWFRRLPWDILAYKYREPGDWNRLRKIKFLDARVVRYPEPLLRHYREMNQRRG